MKKIIGMLIIFLTVFNTGGNVFAESSNPDISVRTGGAWYKYRTIKKATTPKTIVGDVNGIPPGGISFSHGGHLTINTDSGPKFSLSVSVAHKFGSISVGYGGVSNDSVTHNVTIPAGGYYRVRANKVYHANLYRVEKSLYGSGPWTFEREYIREELHSASYTVYRVWNKTHHDEW